MLEIILQCSMPMRRIEQNQHSFRRPKAYAPAVFGLAIILMTMPVFAQQEEAVRVVVKEGQSIRDIARDYLADPDLWITILRFNGFSSIVQVSPGTELQVPVGQVSRAKTALKESLKIIQKATREGAKLFSPDLIGEAINLRDAGLEKRKAGEWGDCAQLAQNAKAAAEQALTATLVHRDAAAEALLTDRQGTVQGRKATDLVWNNLFLNAILIEEEKVRTLSGSTAQITFRDESRLRLNDNSQAVIQSMRVDPLRKTEKAKVTLVEGDLYALLGGKSKRKKFELEVPGVETQIESNNFWASRDAKTSKFTNYDDQRLYVSSAGGTVALEKNQGTLIQHRRKPRAAVDVLPEPELALPRDDNVAFQDSLELSWSAITGAVGYWLEIALDPGFKHMILSRWGLESNRFQASNLGTGLYYWRVATLDNFGLPGKWSKIWRFHIRTDVSVPYLLVSTPQERAIIRRVSLPIGGETEPGVRLTLNGRPLDVDPDGKFAAQHQLRRGINELVFEAVDSAKNITRRVRSVFFMPDKAAAITYDPTIPQIESNHFVTQENVFSLAGLTTSNSQIRVRSLSGAIRATAYSDAAGAFRLNVPIEGLQEVLALEVTELSGFVTRDRFTVTVDKEPPAIELDDWPQPFTAFQELPVRGRIVGGTSLILNGKPVPLTNERFDKLIALQPSKNQIEIVATDLVGNTLVERMEVYLDQEPPKLLGHRLSANRAVGGEQVMIEVQADDASGMKKVAEFTVKVGQRVFSDYLRLNRAARGYRGKLVLPQNVKGKITLTNIELEDYVGNRRRYGFK